jgi:hypothetical protein
MLIVHYFGLRANWKTAFHQVIFYIRDPKFPKMKDAGGQNGISASS